MRTITISKQTRLDIEKHREFWTRVAKEHGWYSDPLYVQVWLYRDGRISDSVSFKGITQDIIVSAEED